MNSEELDNKMIADAEAGMADAQYRLALRLIDCSSEDKTYFKQGIKMLMRAAEQNHAIACYELAYYYECGIEIPKNEKKAFDLYKRSHEQGYITATHKLALCYESGMGTDINPDECKRLMEIVQKNASQEK